MTYKVSSGTLNVRALTQFIFQRITREIFDSDCVTLSFVKTNVLNQSLIPASKCGLNSYLKNHLLFKALALN